jgi:hypothetical protein
MKLLKVQNVYGYPAVTEKFLKWVALRDAEVVVSVHNLEAFERTKQFVVVVAGLSFLESAKVPILGYLRNGFGLYNKCALPSKLRANESTLHIPKFHEQPTSESLLEYYQTQVMPEDWPKRFVNMHKTVCLNDRVFMNKQKDPKQKVNK